MPQPPDPTQSPTNPLDPLQGEPVAIALGAVLRPGTFDGRTPPPQPPRARRVVTFVGTARTPPPL